MTVRFFGLEFANEQERDAALLELKQALDRITEAEREAYTGSSSIGLFQQLDQRYI